MRSAVLVALLLTGCKILAPEAVRSVPSKGDPVVVGDLSYTGSNGGASPTQPLAVQATVTVTNTSSKPTTVDILGGNCNVLLRIFDQPDRTRAPVYDGAQGIECYVPAIHRKLAPGDTYAARSGRYGPAIYLEPGHYYLSAIVVPADRALPRIEVPAGEIIVRH